MIDFIRCLVHEILYKRAHGCPMCRDGLSGPALRGEHYETTDGKPLLLPVSLPVSLPALLTPPVVPS